MLDEEKVKRSNLAGEFQQKMQDLQKNIDGDKTER
jgi:hypothetical protein